jgi:hypothetical protein
MIAIFSKKRLASFVTAFALLAAFSISASAYSYSIPSGSNSWSGKPDNLWAFTTGTERTFTTTVTSTNTVTVTSKLMRLRVLAPDSQILSYTVSNGNSNNAKFVPATGANDSYYANLSTNNTVGATGAVTAA